MDLRKDKGCFVCGPENTRGLRAEFILDKATRTASSRLVIPVWTQGWQAVAHGGILSTLLDESCVHASRTVGDHPVTAELTVRFRKPVPVGSEVFVRGEVVEIRRRVVQVKAELLVDGEVCAEARARVVLVDPSVKNEDEETL
ncbi:MAG: PaaI family thioesterase [Desulfuromonadales bacterium]